MNESEEMRKKVTEILNTLTPCGSGRKYKISSGK